MVEKEGNTMNISEHLTSIWKELHWYGKIVKDLNYVNYRLLTYYYDSALYEVRLERGHVTRIEHIL